MADGLRGDLPDWLDVSRETLDRLEVFGQLLKQWTTRINLVSPSTLPHIWTRHLLDSAQIFTHGLPGRWADFGSGGGLPGIVVAILAAEQQPGMEVHLVESDQRKAVFLRKAAAELALAVTVHAARAEALSPLHANTVSARALAQLPDLLGLVHPHIAAGGRAVLPKGARAGEEINEARRHWSFDLDAIPSKTDPQAQVLVIENLRHA